ncbi:hypothetical protein L195_g030740, partial [Trifolium pratense]
GSFNGCPVKLSKVNGRTCHGNDTIICATVRSTSPRSVSINHCLTRRPALSHMPSHAFLNLSVLPEREGHTPLYSPLTSPPLVLLDSPPLLSSLGPLPVRGSHV